jgi:hypothetical protein
MNSFFEGGESTMERLLAIRNEISEELVRYKRAAGTAECFIGITVVLQWCCSGVTVVLQWCYSGVTVVLQWFHSNAIVLAIRNEISEELVRYKRAAGTAECYRGVTEV